MKSGSTDGATLLVDTSVALRLLDPRHPDRASVEHLRSLRLGLAGHAAFETHAQLTSQPHLRLRPADADAAIARRFVDSRFLDPSVSAALPAEFAAKKIVGGQVYDALVAAAAREHGLVLATRDRRAEPTYRKLGVDLLLL